MRRAEEAGARRGAARGARPGLRQWTTHFPTGRVQDTVPGEQEGRAGAKSGRGRRGGRAGGARRASSAHARGAPNAAPRPHQAPIPTRLLCECMLLAAVRRGPLAA